MADKVQLLNTDTWEHWYLEARESSHWALNITELKLAVPNNQVVQNLCFIPVLIQTKQMEEKEEQYSTLICVGRNIYWNYVCKCRIFILWWLVLTESGYSCSIGWWGWMLSGCFLSLSLSIKLTVLKDAVLNTSYYNSIHMQKCCKPRIFTVFLLLGRVSKNANPTFGLPFAVIYFPNLTLLMCIFFKLRDHILLNLSLIGASQADNHSCHPSLSYFHFYSSHLKAGD